MKNLDLQLEDFNWFEKNKPQLFEQYGECFLAIKNKHVLGAYPSFVEAVQKTETTEEPGTFIVQECTLKPEGNTNTIVSIGLLV